MVKRARLLAPLVAALALSVTPAHAQGPNPQASSVGTCSAYFGQQGQRDDVAHVINDLAAYFGGTPGTFYSSVAKEHGVPVADCTVPTP